MENRLYLRNAVLDDADMLLEWRNDVNTRLNSRNMAMIPVKEHYAWIKRVMDSEDLFFILQDASISVGMVRVAVENGVGTISYNIAPNKRGCGYGKCIIQLLENYILKHAINIKLKAVVKKTNIASQKIFLGQNFSEQEKQDCYVYEKRKYTHQNINANVISGGVVLLTNNRNALPLYEWLMTKDCCLLYSEYITVDVLRNYKPKLVISYNYSYMISEDVIDYMCGQCINLHISMLPWNRGSDPNFWSFVDDTPKGVTIHRVAKGLDTGDIIYQRELEFNEDKETFASSYQVLQHSVVELLKQNWDELLNGSYETFKQNGKGTYHRRCDMKKRVNGCGFFWDMTIKEFKAIFYRTL